MFILGVVSGITMSIGTFLEHKCMKGVSAVPACYLPTPSQYGWDDFPNDRRVSTGAQHWWYWVYACIGLVYVAIFILTSAVSSRHWANMHQKRMLR